MLTQKARLMNTIKLNLKTLYGDRKLYTFLININDNLDKLIDYLIEEESRIESETKWKRNNQYRLIRSIV
jgi:hypothetical protein